MINQLINLDKDLLLLLNSWHNDILDFIMFWISEKITWVPFYLFLLYHVIRNFKLRSVDVLLAVALLIALSDLTSVYGFKEVFQRLRPCHDPVIGSQVQLVYDQCGGKFSFVSSHAVNTFALCFFLISILGKQIKWLTVTMIIWASVVSFSRIYLGVHYPFDVFCGAILGAGIGITMGKLFNTYYEKFVGQNTYIMKRNCLFILPILFIILASGCGSENKRNASVTEINDSISEDDGFLTAYKKFSDAVTHKSFAELQTLIETSTGLFVIETSGALPVVYNLPDAESYISQNGKTLFDFFNDKINLTPVAGEMPVIDCKYANGTPYNNAGCFMKDISSSGDELGFISSAGGPSVEKKNAEDARGKLSIKVINTYNHVYYFSKSGRLGTSPLLI